LLAYKKHFHIEVIIIIVVFCNQIQVAGLNIHFVHFMVSESGSQIIFGYGVKATSLKSYTILEGGSQSSGSEILALDGMSQSRNFHLINFHKMFYSCCMILSLLLTMFSLCLNHQCDRERIQRDRN